MGEVAFIVCSYFMYNLSETREGLCFFCLGVWVNVWWCVDYFFYIGAEEEQ